MPKAIFLDIDGVLNNISTEEYSPEGYTGVDDKFIRNLKHITDAVPDTVIILSSDWRAEWDPERGHGLFITDITPGHTKGKGHTGRGAEIAEYLSAHPDITDYVILDDNDFFDFYDPPCRGHVVITVENDPVSGYGYAMGLTEKFAEDAVKIISHQWSSDSPLFYAMLL